MVTILTDSTADLGQELSRSYQIQTIPLYVNLAEKTLRDGIDVDLETLFSFVDQTGQLPKTSAPMVADFTEAFSEAGECVYISISSQLSATYENAVLAQSQFSESDVQIIDSRNLSTGIGLLALKAAELRDRGFSAAEIAVFIRSMVSKVRTAFVIETLDYLYKGGRCSALENVVGSLLRIRPVIQVREDGSMGVKAKTRGTRRKALEALLEDFETQIPLIDMGHVFITHSGCEEDAQFLHSELTRITPDAQVHITQAGSVIASHCGPNTIGILYLLQ